MNILIPSILFFLFTVSAATGSTSRIHHLIEVTLIPKESRLEGQYNLSIEAGHTVDLGFHLAAKASVSAVAVNGIPAPFEFQNGILRVKPVQGEKNRSLTVAVTYKGTFEDPVPEMPLNTDNPGYGVTGAILEKGCFLQAGAGWYPILFTPGGTFQLRVTSPGGMLAVSAGKSLGHEKRDGESLSIWEGNLPSDGLSLSAGPYVIKEKEMAGGVKAAVYLFPGGEYLAREYLAAIERHVSLYENLFGAYPFEKFAVVENFFPTGYGFPSYTLLGSRVLRLPFIVHTSLAHEIAHCWWGNGVLVDYQKGNWSEGLTTYVADYLMKERESADKAREYRQGVLRNYATLVNRENDLPLARFTERSDPASQVVGYGKGAMLFHMLRRRIGEEAFWGGLREIYRTGVGKRVSWEDFRRTFESLSGKDLQAFFDQWLYRTGAPVISLGKPSVERDESGVRIKGTVLQERPPYELHLPAALETPGRTLTMSIESSEEKTPFEWTAERPPQRLILDPDCDVFRLLDPSEIPPSVNSLKGASSVLVIVPEGSGADIEELARTLVISLGLADPMVLEEDQASPNRVLENDLLFIGFPERQEYLKGLFAGIEIEPEGITVDGRGYDKKESLFFGVFRHPQAEGKVMALFLPLSGQDLPAAARKITHYGRYGYLVFRGGTNVKKGIWPVKNAPLIYEWAAGGD